MTIMAKLVIIVMRGMGEGRRNEVTVYDTLTRTS